MVRELSFAEIKEIWAKDLWNEKYKIEVFKDGQFQPQEIKPMSCMVFNNLQRLDENIFKLYTPLFLGYYNDGIKAVIKRLYYITVLEEHGVIWIVDAKDTATR